MDQYKETKEGPSFFLLSIHKYLYLIEVDEDTKNEEKVPLVR